jgi:cell division protein FtsB
MFVLIGVTISSAVAYEELPQFSKRKEQEVQIETLKSQIEQQQQLLNRRLREESLLKNDPEYIGMIARDRLGLMREGETVFRDETPRLDLSKMHRRD